MKIPRQIYRFLVQLYAWAERFQALAWTFAIIVGSITFVYLYTEKPYLYYQNEPFKVAQKSLRAGDSISMFVVRCNRSRIDQIYLVSRVLENVRTRVQYSIPDAIVLAEPGCHEEMSVEVLVPLDTRPGKYKVVGLSQIQSSFRTNFVGWSSETFEVTP